MAPSPLFIQEGEKWQLTLSRPLDIPVRPRSRLGTFVYISHFLLDFSVFSLIYEKSAKSFLKKKRSLDISLQHKNEASYKFSKKNVCTWPKTGLALKGLRVHKGSGNEG